VKRKKNEGSKDVVIGNWAEAKSLGYSAREGGREKQDRPERNEWGGGGIPKAKVVPRKRMSKERVCSVGRLKDCDNEGGVA